MAWHWQLKVSAGPGGNSLCSRMCCRVVPRSTFNKGLVTLQPALNVKQALHAALFSTLDKLHLRCSDCSPLDWIFRRVAYTRVYKRARDALSDSTREWFRKQRVHLGGMLVHTACCQQLKTCLPLSRRKKTDFAWKCLPLKEEKSDFAWIDNLFMHRPFYFHKILHPYFVFINYLFIEIRHPGKINWQNSWAN